MHSFHRKLATIQSDAICRGLRHVGWIASLCLAVATIGCAGKVETTKASNAKDSQAVDQPTKVAAPTKETKIDPAAFQVWDLESQIHKPFADDSTKAVVLVFIAVDCPIANYYQPTLAKLAENFASDGVSFYLIHADPDLSAEAALKHAEEFQIKSPVILDSKQALARMVNAKKTPEAHLIDREGRVRYCGRIDDLYADYGKRRRSPTTNDLHDAIEALVLGKKITASNIEAVGCYIPYPREETVPVAEGGN